MGCEGAAGAGGAKGVKKAVEDPVGPEVLKYLGWVDKLSFLVENGKSQHNNILKIYIYIVFNILICTYIYKYCNSFVETSTS